MATASVPATLPPSPIATRSSREHELQGRLVDLCAQAERCVVACDEDAEKATTLAVAIKANMQALEDDRMTLTRPLDGVKKDIMARYKLLLAPAEPALEKLTGRQGELTKWNQKKQREREEAERKAREEEERQRLEQARLAEEEAARLKAEGDQEGAAIAQQQAEEALEQAVTAPEKISASSQVTRGAYGGSSGLQRVGKCEITNMADLVAWEAKNVARGVGLKVLQVNDVELGKIARSSGEKPEIPGVRFFYEERSRTW